MAVLCSADFTEQLFDLLSPQLDLIKLSSLLPGTITEEVDLGKGRDRSEDSRGCVTAGLEPSTLYCRLLIPARLWELKVTAASRAMA